MRSFSQTTILEQIGDGPWEPRTGQLSQELKSNRESSTLVIFASQAALKPLPKSLFPEDFASIIDEDLNGAFACDYSVSDVVDDDTITRHVSWTCFKIKRVLEPNHYDWVQTTVLVNWDVITKHQTVLFIDLPEEQETQIQSRLSGIKSCANPFTWHMLFSKEVIKLYNTSIWSIRDLVRGIEKARSVPHPTAPNFPHLHDIGRHICHSDETLEVAENTMQSLVAEQMRWRTELPGLVPSRAVYLHTQQRLHFLAKEMHSLKTRSKSLTERLHNEINLAFNLVSQRFGRDAQSDSAMMKTVGVVSLVYLPGTFVSGVFGTNFFDFDAGGDSWAMSSTFWLYWATTLPLTLLTVAVWALWHYVVPREAQSLRALSERFVRRRTRDIEDLGEGDVKG